MKRNEMAGGQGKATLGRKGLLTMSASSDSNDYGRLDELAEEFVARYRRGEQPSVQEYVDRLPEMADDIRDLFPALVAVEVAHGDGRAAIIPSASPVAPPHRTQIGDYRILSEIGRGGMGVVYEAEQVSLGRRVALKVLAGHLGDDPRTQERFRREAKSAARLHHTNIVPVFEVGRDRDIYFYAMQLIQGQGLEQIIAEVRRQRTPSAPATGNQPFNSDGPDVPETVPQVPVSSTSIARKRELSQAAEWLLSGRLANEGEATDLAGANPITPTEPDTNATGRFDPDATSGLATSVATREHRPAPHTPNPSGPAMLPGGTPVSEVDSSGRRLPFFRSVAQIGRQAAQALAHAHSRGVVHRDIKPSNLLLDTDGIVWITDFGLAKDEDNGLTATGDILGTLRYMAPERFRGEADARADIYALGLTLYELLTLRPAYGSSDRLRLIEQIKNEEPARPRSIDRHIPRDLETIVQKAIEKEPAARYQTADAMAEDLRRFLSDEPIRARQVGRAERAWRWSRRNPGVALLLAAVAASLLLGMAGTSYYAIQAQSRAQEARASAQIAREEKARSDLRWYAAESTLTQKDWAAGELASLERRLEALEPHEPTAPDLRGFEWYHLRRLCRLELLTIPAHSAPLRCVSMSPSGKQLASASGNHGEPGEVKLWDMATGRECLCLRGHKNLVSCVAFSPDGRWLASANGGVSTPGEIKIWDAADGRELASLSAHAVPVRGLAFSPDGRQLASFGGGVGSRGGYLPGEVKVWDMADRRQLLCISGSDAGDWMTASSAVAFSPNAAQPRLAFVDGNTVRVCDPATGNDLFRLGKHPNLANSVAFSPDGRRLASGSVDGVVKIWNAETGSETLAFRHPEGIMSLAFSPDNRRLAAAAGNNVVKVWDLTTQEESLVLQGHMDTVASVAFSPDGWRLASGGGDGTVKLWDATAPAETVTLNGRAGSVKDIAFDADGRKLAIASGSLLRILDTTTGVEVFTLTGHIAFILGVTFSPDGRRLASVGEDRTVRVWDATNGLEIYCLRGHTAPVHAAAFTPDGQRLASISRGSPGKGQFVPGETVIWDLRKGQELLKLPGQTEPGKDSWFTDVTFSPDGVRLATSEGRIVRVRNAATGQEILPPHSLAGAVTRLAFSPDGSRLAAGIQDGSVKVWDTINGEACVALRAHTSSVSGLAYSSDGRRLVTVAGGTNKGGERLSSEVKLWDAITGQEILTLHGLPAQAPSLALDRGGRRLAASGDIGVTIWEGIPLDAELAEQRQAASLVKFLFSQSPTPTVAAVSILVKNYAVSDGVRQRALALVEPFWKNRVGQQAEQEVRALFAKPLFRADALAHLRADSALSEPVRQEALALAARYAESPYIFDRVSREVAGRPGAKPSEYRLAAQQAELVCRLMPFEGSYQTTLGMAQYRLGQYQDALATLTRADELNRSTDGGSIPADLAFLAMSQHQLRERDRAQKSLTQLRETLRKPNWARNEKAQTLLKEAEALLSGHGSQPRK